MAPGGLEMASLRIGGWRCLAWPPAKPLCLYILLTEDHPVLSVSLSSPPSLSLYLCYCSSPLFSCSPHLLTFICICMLLSFFLHKSKTHLQTLSSFRNQLRRYQNKFERNPSLVVDSTSVQKKNHATADVSSVSGVHVAFGWVLPS